MIFSSSSSTRSHETGSVFILVLTICFGLVTLALYFGQSMTFEVRGAANRVSAMESDQVLLGASRYATFVLATYATNGAIPNPLDYDSEGVTVGDGKFWFIGRTNNTTVNPIAPTFGLVDENSKLNLNTVTAAMLELLPGMTHEFAAAIIDWRDADATVSDGGAEDDVYQRLSPPRKCKNAPFESVDELRLVYGATLEILYGEDANQNGFLDPNENDGNVLSPEDNKDGRLDPGICEYLTVHSRQSATMANGTNKTEVSSVNAIRSLLTQSLQAARANAIMAALGPRGARSVLEFYALSGMTVQEFQTVEAQLYSTNSMAVSAVNVNTAPEAVLACIPGISLDKASALVNYRASNPQILATVAWVKEVLDTATIQAAGPYLIGQSCQFTADIAAVGEYGRGFRRTRFIFDTSQLAPVILSRQDLTYLGWPLGSKIHDQLLKKDIR
ncbi:MAG: ral secretion pathway protein [Verrucomicrobiales bacterium]|nr:ral secretion pathway protein [Verrucomicrobiales bacterium]